jgi:hypothetical protein
MDCLGLLDPFEEVLLASSCDLTGHRELQLLVAEEVAEVQRWSGKVSDSLYGL